MHVEKSRLLNKLFADYASYHQTRGNQITHLVGIPLIIVSLLGLLSRIVFLPSLFPGLSLLQLDAGVILLIFGIVFYLFLDWKLAIAFGFVLSGFYFVGRALPLRLSWAFFILGWILQGVGHFAFEKKSPAFFRNGVHLVIGPFWIFAEFLGYRHGKV